MTRIDGVFKYLKNECLPILSSFYTKYGIRGQYKHWLTAKFKLNKARVFLGGVAGSMPIGKVEVSIHVAEFLAALLKAELPDMSQMLSGEGIYFCYSVYPTHQVKPFKICFKCARRSLENGKGWFFCRTDTYQLCQDCGLVEFVKRDNPKVCPPYHNYLYLKVPLGGNVFDNKLQILSQEDFNPGIRERNHSVKCTSCQNENFPGIRFKCAVCQNCEVCERCMGRMVKNGGTEATAEEVYASLKTAGCLGIKDHIFLAIYLNNTF